MPEMIYIYIYMEIFQEEKNTCQNYQAHENADSFQKQKKKWKTKKKKEKKEQITNNDWRESKVYM